MGVKLLEVLQGLFGLLEIDPEEKARFRKETSLGIGKHIGIDFF